MSQWPSSIRTEVGGAISHIQQLVEIKIVTMTNLNHTLELNKKKYRELKKPLHDRVVNTRPSTS